MMTWWATIECMREKIISGFKRCVKEDNVQGDLQLIDNKFHIIKALTLNAFRAQASSINGVHNTRLSHDHMDLLGT